MPDSNVNPATPSPKPGPQPHPNPPAPATPQEIQPEANDELLYGQCPMPMDIMPEAALREFVSHLQTGRRSAQTFKANVQNRKVVKEDEDATPKKSIEDQFSDFL